MSADTIALILALIFILLGLAGTVIPLLPGIPLIFITIAAYGWHEGFQVINARFLVVMAALTILSLLVDYLSTALGASYFGSSKSGVWGAIIGTFLGLLIFAPVGIFLGPWLGASIGEYIACQDLNKAMKSGIGTVIGLFSGIVFNLILALVMLVTFLIKVF
ncbi:DUF456 domain-containing protein [Syntrophomonas curvata]